MASSHFGAATREPPEAVIQRVVEPGERIIWAGRPDYDALTEEARRVATGRSAMVSGLKALAFVAIAVVGWAYATGVGIEGLPGLPGTIVQSQPVKTVVALFVVMAFAGLGFWINSRSARAFMRRAGALSYAITERRLLIVLDDEIETEYSPDTVRSPKLVARTRGFTDIQLEFRGAGQSGRGDPLSQRERRRIGFKALADAEAVRDLIEGWRDAHLTASERSVEDFLADRPDRSIAGARDNPSPGGGRGSGDVPADGPATQDEISTPRDLEALDDDEARIRGGRYDLAVTAPGGWDVKVRQRKHPFGKVSLDVVRWQSPEDASGWNVVHVDGPFGTAVEVHVDAVAEPTQGYQEAAGSALSGMVAGEVVGSEPDLRRGRFRGWSVTRRRKALGGSAGSELDQPGFFRHTTLHDGVLQLAFVTTWPVASEPLAEVVDRIEASVSVTSEGISPVPVSGGAVEGAMGCAGSLLTAARIVIGLFFLLIGVGGGYDQTRRAEAYDDAAVGLMAAVDDGLPVLPGDDVVTTHDGELAFLQGPLTPAAVEDSLTGLTVPGWRLVRTVELRQWREIETMGRSTSSSTPNREYSYERVWSSDLIDSNAFDDPLLGGDERVNPDRKPYPDEVFISADLRLGAWRLPALTWGSPEREPVPDSILVAAVAASGWSVDDGYLYDGSNADVRLRYVYHPVPAGTYSVIGIPEDGVLDLEGALVELPLLTRGRLPPEEIVASVAQTSRGVQSMWMIYSWIGLVILLRPMTRRFELFRRLTDAPFPRRLLMTAAVSAGIVLVLAAWFYS